MDTLEFLRRVLPTEGFYCSLQIHGRGARNTFHTTLTELRDAVVATDETGRDAYFAISTFVENTNRRKSNVQATKVVAVDIDCGPEKPYPNWKAGLKALGAFLKALNLPDPLVVRSGYGLHVYWVLEEALEPDRWWPLANALKAAARDHRLENDSGLTANSALVLRPIGTRNHKDKANPKPVELFFDAPDVDPDSLKLALAYYYHAPKASSGLSKKQTALMESLAVQQDYPPAVGSVVAEQCQQVKWATENQDKVPEPLWYSLLGLAAFCEEPEATAIAWSRAYPGYSEAETLKKLRNWQANTTGPTTCAKFEAERPKGCKGCPFAGKIGSPIRLGARYQEAEATEDAPDDIVAEIPVPKPFKRISVGKGNGFAVEANKVEVRITDFDLYPVSYGYDESLGYEVAQFMWNRPHVGWKILSIRQAYLVDGAAREFATAVADQGIVLESKGQTEYLQTMLRSYMNELRKRRTVTNLYSTMGWKEENRMFVMGDDLYRRTETGEVTHEVVRLAAQSTRAGSDMFTVKGDYETWKATTDLLGKGKLKAHQFSIGLGFASVLMQFTGLKGVTVSFYGPSGSGKSLAQFAQQSIYGDPAKLHFQSKYTANALFNRFGTYSNLPITVDEATQMSDKDVGDMLYWVSQGRDKARLSRVAEERAPREWALTATLSTNRPLISKLISTGDEADAQMARLVEFRVDPCSLFSENSDVGRKLYNLFGSNYGHAGREFVRKLMEIGEEGIMAMIAEATAKFPQQFHTRFSGVERYWEATFVLTSLGLRLAHDWGIIRFSPTDCIRWGLNQLPEMRSAVDDNRLDAFDMLAEYLNEHAHETVELYRAPGQEPKMSLARPAPHGAIRVRIEGFRDVNSPHITNGVLYLDRTHFRRWFAEKGGNPRAFFMQVQRDNADATPLSKKASLGKNTGVRLPQVYVLGIRLTHERLAGILDTVSRNYEDMTVGEVRSVVTELSQKKF